MTKFNRQENRIYFTTLLTVALPIVLQHFVRSGLNLVSGLIIGQLGDVPIAGVGLANQIYFLVTLMMFGISTGCAVFTAQFWGKGDIPNLRRVMGICMIMSITGGLIFFIASAFFPEQVIGIYTKDPAVRKLGGDFLRVMSPSLLIVSISFSYATLLRSAGDVKTPLYASIIGLGFSTVLGYMLVFGKMGFPKVGVNGAAIGINVGRFIEAVLLLWVIYHYKRPVAASIKEMLDFDTAFFRTVFTRALPVALNETLWSLGVTTFNIIYARIGTDAIAAVNIATTIENLAFVAFMGVSDGLGILIGNQIGSGGKDGAYAFARKTYLLVLGGAVAMGGLVFLFADDILRLYKVSELVNEYALYILYMVAISLWAKTSNMTMIVGVLRAGGDTRFSFLLDSLSIWLVGVPMAFLGAFVFHLPVYWVALMASSEEFVKFGISLVRFKSRKWIYDLTEITGGIGTSKQELS